MSSNYYKNSKVPLPLELAKILNLFRMIVNQFSFASFICFRHVMAISLIYS